MTNHGDDCYFFYYSTCSKGDSCPFRHCEAAMGSETMCSLWQENRCFRKVCKFRHMEIKKKRNEIPCYWENQPAGCQKSHCAFHHEKPRMIDGVFVPPSRGPVLKREVEEEPAPAADPASPAPAPIANPANPQVRGVIKAETLENVPSPTHPPVVINPADDEDEDEDDQFSEEGEESSSRIVSPRKLSGGNKDDSLNFGIRTLEEIRLRKALKANLKKAGQSPSSLSQGTGQTPPLGLHSNGTSGEKENIRSFIRPSQFSAKEDTPLQIDEPAKRHIAERLGKRKAILPAEQHFVVKKDLPVASEPPLKRTLAERLGRKVDSPEDDADALPRKAVKPVRDRLGLPAEPAAPDNEREVQASGEIRIKTLEEIRQEKMAKAQGQEKVAKAQGQEKAAKAQGQGPGTAVTKAPSPVKRSAKPPAGVHVKTFSEVLHARKRQQEKEKEVQRKEAGEEPGKPEAPPQEEVPGKKARAQPQPSEVRVKTLEEIRKEKAARAQAREQEVKTEESSAPPSALPKRRILRINKTTAAGADNGSNPNTPEATEKPPGPVTAENGAANGRQDSPGQTVKVKTFEEIMQEKRLRKQQGEQGAGAEAGGSSSPPEEASPPSAPKPVPTASRGQRALSALRLRAGTASQPASPPAQPEATPTTGRPRVALRQKESSPATPAPATVPKPSGRAQARAGSPSASAGGVNSPPAEQKAPPPAPAAALGEEPAPPAPAQEEEPQPERTQSPAPRRSPVQTAETKVRPKLNVKPSVVKAASQVKLGQKRKASESHRSAVAAVKPLNSAPAAVEDQPPEPSCKRADLKAPETAAPSVSVEAEAQARPPGPRLSSPAPGGTSETELHRTANAEQSPAPTAPVLSPAKEPPAAPQSSPAAKTPVQPKPRRQSTAATRATAALDDLDELMNEFADDPLDGEMELDPGKDEDDLLLELSEMIDS
ncbi:zinc finger CCCH domain-containing protein 11A isoform X3 [Anguilla anguilla]|uniref:zinc finger CCCH domain-containing protein 11A isoform X2 n=1 Tax=Anguilla anguilla TaxID=7936 RepID=UPI0015AD9E00|nr:zinc finger CCCH domain-containing protein 11A isoform X2 [Anguilla anguilla]XP_035243124.1 zinc finger CCCH domain-containing protein 11A isoform X3 [Anguilla anguilla]